MNCTKTPGKKRTPPRDPPRRRANKRTGHGTYANDRPPTISLISRETGEQRFWVGNHADRRMCQALIAENMLPDGTQRYTGEWQSYQNSHPAHATVRHGIHEWVRDDDGMADAKSMATPVREQAWHCEPTCGPSAVSTNGTCICPWQRMRPWSIRNASHLR